MTWKEVTTSDLFREANPEERAEYKRQFFQKYGVPTLREQGLDDDELNIAADAFFSAPDDTGEGLLRSAVGSAARGFLDPIPSTLEVAGAFTGIESLEEAGKAVRGGIESMTPVNPAQQGFITDAAGVLGQGAQILATGGAGAATGLKFAGKAASEAARLQAAKFGAQAAQQAAMGSSAVAGGLERADQLGLEGGDRLLRGAIAGGTEFATEKLGGFASELGPIKKFLGDAPVGSIEGDWFGIPKSIAVPVSRGIVTEAGEEGVAEAAGQATDIAMAPEAAPDMDAKQVAYAMLLGSVGGAMFGGVEAAIAPRTKRAFDGTTDFVPSTSPPPGMTVIEADKAGLLKTDGQGRIIGYIKPTPPVTTETIEAELPVELVTPESRAIIDNVVKTPEASATAAALARTAVELGTESGITDVGEVDETANLLTGVPLQRPLGGEATEDQATLEPQQPTQATDPIARMAAAGARSSIIGSDGEVDRAATQKSRQAKADAMGVSLEELGNIEAAEVVESKQAFWDSLGDGDVITWVGGDGRTRTAEVEVTRRGTKYVVADNGYEFDPRTNEFIMNTDTLSVSNPSQKQNVPLQETPLQQEQSSVEELPLPRELPVLPEQQAAPQQEAAVGVVAADEDTLAGNDTLGSGIVQNQDTVSKGDLATVKIGGREYPKTRIINVVKTPEGTRYQVDVFGPKFLTRDAIVSTQQEPKKAATAPKASPQLVRQLGDIAVKNNEPVSQSYIDAVGGRIPSGYVKSGDGYEYSPKKQFDPDSIAKEEAFNEAREALRDAMNAGKGKFIGNRFGLLVTPSNNPDVMLRVTRLDSDGNPLGHSDIKTEEEFEEAANDEDFISSVLDSVRPDVGQARFFGAFNPGKLKRPATFNYRLRLRDVAPGTVPDGFISADGRNVSYNRPLTREELDKYEISPVSASKQPPTQVSAEPTADVPTESLKTELPKVSPATTGVVPTESLPATGQPTLGSVGVARDATKPEQMTPDEAMTSNKARTRYKESFKTLKEAKARLKEMNDAIISNPNLAKIANDFGLSPDRLYSAGKIVFPNKSTGYAVFGTHENEVAASAQQKLPVSSAAVEAYNITLPDGYTLNETGDLYVYNASTTPQETKAPSPPPSSVKASEEQPTPQPATKEPTEPQPAAEATGDALTNVNVEENVPLVNDASTRLRNYIATLPAKAQAAWSQERLAAADSYYATGDTKALERLTKAQQKVVRDNSVSAAESVALDIQRISERKQREGKPIDDQLTAEEAVRRSIASVTEKPESSRAKAVQAGLAGLDWANMDTEQRREAVNKFAQSTARSLLDGASSLKRDAKLTLHSDRPPSAKFDVSDGSLSVEIGTNVDFDALSFKDNEESVLSQVFAKIEEEFIHAVHGIAAFERWKKSGSETNFNDWFEEETFKDWLSIFENIKGLRASGNNEAADVIENTIFEATTLYHQGIPAEMLGTMMQQQRPAYKMYMELARMLAQVQLDSFTSETEFTRFVKAVNHIFTKVLGLMRKSAELVKTGALGEALKRDVAMLSDSIKRLQESAKFATSLQKQPPSATTAEFVGDANALIDSLNEQTLQKERENREDGPELTNETTVAESVVDENLSDKEKSDVAAAYSKRNWNAAKDAFYKDFAKFLSGTYKATGKLLGIMRDLAVRMGKTTANVIAAISFTVSSTQVTEAISPRQIATGIPQAVEIAQMPANQQRLPSGGLKPNIPQAASLTGIGAPSPSNQINISGGVTESSAQFPKSRKNANFAGKTAPVEVVKTANWIVANNNNEGYPFVIADKQNGNIFAFDEAGNLVMEAPALYGEDLGDVADLSKSYESEESKVTPTGRFFADVGADAEYGETLDFLDAGDYSISIHKTYLGDPSEKRVERYSTADPSDNRVSYGCINLPEKQMRKLANLARPSFGAYVYVLPETAKGRGIFNKALGGSPLRPSITRATDGAVVSTGVNPTSARAARNSYIGVIPGAEQSWLGTVAEFEAEFGDTVYFGKDLTNPGSMYEALVTNDGRVFIFTDNVKIKQVDKRLSEQYGTTPGVEAIKRLMRHESFGHRGFMALPTPLKQRFVDLIDAGVIPEADLDSLVNDRDYAHLKDWRTVPAVRQLAAEEWLAQRMERMQRIPKSGPMQPLLDWLRDVWRWLTGGETDDLVQLRDIMREMHRALGGLEPGQRIVTVGEDIRASMADPIRNYPNLSSNETEVTAPNAKQRPVSELMLDENGMQQYVPQKYFKIKDFASQMRQWANDAIAPYGDSIAGLIELLRVVRDDEVAATFGLGTNASVLLTPWLVNEAADRAKKLGSSDLRNRFLEVDQSAANAAGTTLNSRRLVKDAYDENYWLTAAMDMERKSQEAVVDPKITGRTIGTVNNMVPEAGDEAAGVIGDAVAEEEMIALRVLELGAAAQTSPKMRDLLEELIALTIDYGQLAEMQVEAERPSIAARRSALPKTEAERVALMEKIAKRQTEILKEIDAEQKKAKASPAAKQPKPVETAKQIINKITNTAAKEPAKKKTPDAVRELYRKQLKTPMSDIEFTKAARDAGLSGDVIKQLKDAIDLEIAAIAIEAKKRADKRTSEKELKEAEDEESANQKKADAKINEVAERLSDPSLTQDKAKKVDEFRKLYEQQVREPLPVNGFVDAMVALEVDEDTAEQLFDIAALDKASRDAIKGAKQDAKYQTDALAKIKEVVDRLADPAVTQNKERKVNKLRDLYENQVKTPESYDDFRAKAAFLSLDMDVTRQLFDAAALDADSRQRVRDARADIKAREISEAQASRLIYSQEETLRQGNKDREQSADGDSINKAFREQVAKPMPMDAFVERLGKLKVTKATAERMYRTAERVAVDNEAAILYKQRSKFLDVDTAALANFVNELRRGGKLTGKKIKWADLLSLPVAHQETIKAQLLDRVKKHNVLRDLSASEQVALAEALEKIWQRERRKIFKRMIKRADMTGVSKDTQAVIAEAAPAMLRYINQGMLGSSAFYRAVGEKFGIEPFSPESIAKIEKLAAQMQEPGITSLERGQLASKLTKEIQSQTVLPMPEVLSSYWVTSVLSGTATQVDMALNVSTGMLSIAKKVVASIIKTGSTKDARAGLSAFGSGLIDAAQIAWPNLWDKDLNLLPQDADSAMAFLADGGSNAGLGTGEKMMLRKGNKPQDKIYRGLGAILAFYNRLFSGLDFIVSSATAAGTFQMAAALNPRLYDAALIPTKEDKANAFKQAQIRFPNAPRSQQLALSQSMIDDGIHLLGKNLDEATMQKFKQVRQDVKMEGRTASYQEDPTGMGGVIYESIKKSTAWWTEVVDEARKKARKRVEDKKAVLGDDRNWNITAQMSIKVLDALYLLSSQSQNALGFRFMRFAGNKFNELISYIPALGLLRLEEEGMFRDGVRTLRGQNILHNQAIGLMAGTLFLWAMKALNEDDEERGWIVNGSWKNLTPERKKQQIDAGFKENSISFLQPDGTWRSYNYISWPLAGWLASFGAISDYKRLTPEKWDEKSLPSKIAAGMYAGVSSISDISSLSNLTEMFGRSSNTTDPAKNFSETLIRAGSSYVGGFVPKVIKDMETWIDGNYYKPEEPLDFIAKELPFFRRSVGAPLRDIFAEPIQIVRTPWRRIVQQSKDDEAYKNLAKLNARGLWLTPPNPKNRKVRRGGATRDLTSQEADAYVTEVGKAYKRLMESRAETFLKMPVERVEQLIEKATTRIREIALRKALSGAKSVATVDE